MPDAQEVAKLIEAEGRKAVLLPGDITDKAFCETLVKKAVTDLGGLDILVNNAGKQTNQKDIGDITDEQFDRTLKTNLYAMFWITKATLPHMPAGASIINTASVVAYNPPQILVDYATTKAGIVAFSKALAKQQIAKGIRVNAVAPGPFWTALQPSGGQPQENVEKFGSEVPLGRPGQPWNSRRSTCSWRARSQLRHRRSLRRHRRQRHRLNDPSSGCVVPGRPEPERPWPRTGCPWSGAVPASVDHGFACLRCNGRGRLGSYIGPPHLGVMTSEFDVIIVGEAQPASAPRGGLPPPERRPCCLRRPRCSEAAPIRRTSTATPSTWAASGCTRATATPGSASPRRRASRSTGVTRRGRRRILASPGTRTPRRRPERRSATGRSGSGGRVWQRQGKRRPGTRGRVECLRAGHRWLHERGCAREHLCHRLPGLRRRLDRQELEPAARLRHAGRRQPAILCGTTPSYPVEGIDLTADGVAVITRAGTVRAKATILTVSTAVLAATRSDFPPETSPGARRPPPCRSGATRRSSWRSGATPRSSRTRMRTATCATPGRPPTRSAPTVGRSSRRSSGAREPSSWRRKARPPASSTCPLSWLPCSEATWHRPSARSRPRHGAGWPPSVAPTVARCLGSRTRGRGWPGRSRTGCSSRARRRTPSTSRRPRGTRQRATGRRRGSIRAPRGAVPCDARRLLTGRIMVAASFEHWMIRAARQPANRE